MTATMRASAPPRTAFEGRFTVLLEDGDSDDRVHDEAEEDREEVDDRVAEEVARRANGSLPLSGDRLPEEDDPERERDHHVDEAARAQERHGHGERDQRHAVEHDLPVGLGVPAYDRKHRDPHPAVVLLDANGERPEMR